METRVIKIGSSLEGLDYAVEEAVAVLSEGGLVGFPTETVYGLAANASLETSIEKLAEIKQRPVNKPFTLHIGDKAVLSRYVPDLSLLNRQFLCKAWPGPLTVVFDLNDGQMDQVNERFSKNQVEALYHNCSIGIRLPSHPVARELLSEIEDPVVATSANLANQPPPTNADDVLEELDGHIELLLDAGETQYEKASTIARLTNDGVEILREGVLDAPAVQRMRTVAILFVCTGNICRSPMAEGLAKKMLAERLDCAIDDLEEKGYKIGSAGMMACDRAEASTKAVEACDELGVDIRSHMARQISTEMLEKTDFVYVMDRSHRMAVMELATPARRQQRGRKIDFLRTDGGEVSDPIGMSLDTYRNCAKQIAESVRERLDQIL